MCSRFLALVGALLLSVALMPYSAKAGHNSGLNISYTCLGGNSYEITVNLFRDCSDPEPAAPSLNVYIYSSCENIGFESFPLVDVEEVSQLCPTALPNSNCAGGTEPGVELSIYQQVVTLENCEDWRIVVAEQNRSPVSNLVDPEVNRIHVEAFLNNENGDCNTSPSLGVLNLPYICVSAPLFYNLGFNEPDGDSLVYELAPALTSIAPNAPEEMAYPAGYSGEEPLTGISINPSNGQLSVTPALTGLFNAVVMVSEYRNGQLIGQVAQDFLFLINPCPVPTPAPVAGSLAHVSGGGYPLSDQAIGICEEDDFCFEIAFSSQEAAYEISITSTIETLVPSATTTVTGTNPATVQFCGSMPPGLTSGSFLVIATDDACPVMGQTFLAIDFVERQPMLAGTDSLICPGEPLTLFAENGGVHTWTYLDGSEVTAGSDLSCNPCDNPLASPDTTTTFVVTGAYTESSCANTAAVTLTVPLTWSIDVADESCVGGNGSIAINVQDGSGNYEVIWDDIGPGGLTRTGLSTGTYTATVTDAVYGCTRVATVDVGATDFPIADAGTDTEVCGLSYDLNAVPGPAPAGWLPAPAGVTLSDVNDPGATATATDPGTYTLSWVEDAGGGCSDTAQVAITFFAPAAVSIDAPDTVCGPLADIEVEAVNATTTWSGPDGLLFGDTSAEATAAEAPTAGSYTAVVTGINGPCTVSDTALIHFVAQPDADAGSEASVCGEVLTLAALPTVGEGSWVLPPNLTASPGTDNPTVQLTTDAYGLFEAIWVEVNEGFCSDADTLEIRFTQQPVVALEPDTALCGNTAILNPEVPVGQLNWLLPAGYSATDAQGIPTEITGPYGSFTIGLSADNGFGCTAAANQVITFIETPEIFLPATTAVCGLSTTLDAGSAGDAWTWTSEPGITLVEQGPGQAEVSTAATGTFEVTFETTNSGLCTAMATTSMSFFESPDLSATGDAEVCGLEASVGVSYLLGDLNWDLPAEVTAAPLPGDSLALTAAVYGTFQIGVSATNGLCVESDSVEVTFLSTPTIQNPNWTCTGIDAQYTVSFEATLGNPLAYEVSGLAGSFDGGVFTSLPLPSETPVEVVLSDDGTCGSDTLAGSLFCPILSFSGNMDTDTIRICGSGPASILPAANPTLDGNDTLIYALHTNSDNTLGEVMGWAAEPVFSLVAPMNYGTPYYVSSVVGNATSTGVDLDDPFLSIAPGTPVVFYEPPMASLSGSAVACPYDTVLFQVELSGALPQMVTYTANGVETTITAAQSPLSIAATEPGNYTLVSTTSAWCAGEADGTAVLAHDGIPEAMLLLPDFVCEGTEALLEVEFEGIAPFSFELHHEGVSIGSFSEVGPSWSAEVTAPGLYGVVGLTDDRCTSSEAYEATLDVRPLPTVDAGPDISTCSGDTLSLGTPPVAGHTYSWAPHPGLENVQSPQPTFSMAHQLPSSVSVSLVVTASLNGCFASDSVRIDVYAYPDIQFSGLNPFCAGDSIAVFASGGPFVEWAPAALFSEPNQALSTFTATVPTEIEVQVSNEGNCTSTLTGQVEVWPLPDASFTAAPSEGCAPIEVAFTPNDAAGDHAYKWDAGQGAETANGAFTETYVDAGTYPVSLEVTSPEGCTDRYTLPTPIEVFDTRARFDYSPENPTVIEPVVSFFNQSPDGVESLWTFGEVGSSQSRHADFRFPDGAGARYEVCLLVTSPEGCVDQICKWIEVADDFFLFIPNAFTPDGDGLNDLFGPVLSHTNLVEYSFWIANRRGQVVFETNDPHQKWDGSGSTGTHYEGNDVYVWKITVRAGFDVDRKEYTGTVVLMR